MRPSDGRGPEPTDEDIEAAAKKLAFATAPHGAATIMPASALAALANVAVAPQLATGGRGSPVGAPTGTSMQHTAAGRGGTAGMATNGGTQGGGGTNAPTAAQAAQQPGQLHGLRGVFERLQLSLEERKKALIWDCAIQMGHTKGDAGAISNYKT